MRRSSHVVRTVALGIIADDIFGALMNASSAGHEAIPPAWMIANRGEARPAEIRLPALDDSRRFNLLAR
jgi:hypothetical protein